MNLILISDHGCINGGVSCVVFDSMRLLRDAGVKVVFVCGTECTDRNAVPNGVEVVSCNQHELLSNPSKINAMVTGIWNAKARAVVGALLEKYDPRETVVHVHGWCKVLSPSIFSVLRESGFKTFLTCHDYFVACPNGAFYDFVRGHACYKVGGGLGCLFCNCDVRNFAHKVWRWARHQVVSYQLKRFVDLRMVTLSECNERIVRKCFGGKRKYIHINNPVKTAHGTGNTIVGKNGFVFVGRASAEKGLRLFADAVSRTGVEGIVVGDGGEMSEIRAAYPALDYLGWKTPEEVSAVLHTHAAVLVFPSICFETAGMAALEALSMAIPCIISDITATAELVEDGKTGLLFKSGDVEDLVRKIEMLKDPVFRRRMSENIREHFDIEKWSESGHVQNLLSAYGEALKEVCYA